MIGTTAIMNCDVMEQYLSATTLGRVKSTARGYLRPEMHTAEKGSFEFRCERSVRIDRSVM